MKLSKLINENKYTNQTGIKSSLLNNVEFLSLLTQPAKNWIIGRDVRIYKGDLGFVFTDGKREMVFNLKKPFSLIKRLGNARAEIKTIYQQNESVNEAKYNVGDTITVTLKGGKTVKGKVEKLNPLKVRTGPTSVQVLGNHLIQNILKESVNELKKLPSGNFSIKKGYNTFADYEKNAKPGDTILKYDKRGNMVKTFVSGNELHQNAKKYLSKVHSIVGDKVNLSLFGKQGYSAVPDYEKKEVGVLVLESVNESKNLKKAKQALIDFNNGKLGEDEMVKTVIKSLGFKFDKYSDEEAGMVLGRFIKQGKIPTDNYVLDDVIDVLEESVNEAKKPIGKKVFSNAKGKLFFGYQNDDDTIQLVDYKTWKKLPMKDLSNEFMANRVINSIVGNERQLNKKVDYNMWSKKTNPSFEDRMDYFIKNNWISNITKAGIRESVESINENNEIGKQVWINTSNRKLYFGYLKSDTAVSVVDYKTWKKLPLKDVTNDDMANRLTRAILNRQPHSDKEVEYNRWVKKTNPSFEQKMDWFIKNGWISNITRDGIREGVESVNENFAKFDTLKMAVNQHEKGAPYYDKIRLINIFNQLSSSDQVKAKKQYRGYFGESVNEIKKGSVVIPYAMDKYGEFIVDKVFKNKSGETSYTGKFKKSGESREFILHSKDRIVKESVNENDGVYFKSYTAAIEAATAAALKRGFEVSDDELFTKVGVGSKKPSVGKTTMVSLELTKAGKPQRKMLHIQVYGMNNGYELNYYIN